MADRFQHALLVDLELTLDHGQEEVFLAAEVAVNGFLGNPGFAGHHIDTGAVEALTQEGFASNIKHFLALVGRSGFQVYGGAGYDSH